MKDVPNIFGSMVFNDAMMKDWLPKETYTVLKQTIAEGKQLDSSIANIVATAMKNWAVENGATHFTHWFQPLTGATAEKHDSFISVTGDGSVIMELSGKSLVKGESDASSFPSGGLRATFEARGYTAWDPTSYAFIKDETLYIPTAFCSYNGDALDKKTPLLRSMEAVDKQAKRVLSLFGEADVSRVQATVGAEQEYFLIDRSVYDKRPDLIQCGRTLFGANPPKSREIGDHYYGAIKPRVFAFMEELDRELWKLGVTAKTEHNEAAPAQHELALIFSSANIATDHNQLTMELMRSVAARHGLVCLLHEKPFAGVNGSGKHNNWSLATNTGVNLLKPGATPSNNARFLLFLCAVIAAVDEYQDLLRLCVASAGNDQRLGGSEAPPAIISIFLGDELTHVLDAIENETMHEDKGKSRMEIGATVLPYLLKDTTDRNRTSPFAFTGDKFEFRMAGSSLSISDPNTVLNTIVAEVLSGFADTLEQSSDFVKDLGDLIRSTISKHKRIIFDGNNYSDEWEKEAAARGLLNLRTTVDALPYLLAEKNIELFTKHRVFTESELRSRYEILMDGYCNTVQAEAATLVDLTRKRVIPAVFDYIRRVAWTADCVLKFNDFQNVDLSMELEEATLTALSKLKSSLSKHLGALEEACARNAGPNGADDKDVTACARFCCDVILPRMDALRADIDKLETVVGAEDWPFPTYAEIFSSVR